MIMSLLSAPLKIIPQPVTAVSLSIVLNLFFTRYPELKKRLGELDGKIFQFEIEDMDESLYMNVDETGQLRIHTYCDNIPHVTMSGNTSAFLSLLFHTSDPDSLFFSRQLKLSGETDTGLRFKNLLDNVEIDWERELAILVGQRAAKTLMGMARKTKLAGQQGKEFVESEVESWLQGHGFPSRNQLQEFAREAEAVSERFEKLEKSVTRLERKRAVANSGTATGKNDPADTPASPD
ncbi:MAG: SCP2 sterol-binding domain-containing protein [Magnetococcales bacterium]|nr:SCP2 sterol-binding domain-containing protein [Magnetococcales bacterium]